MIDDVADHGFLDNRLRLREPRRGHRSGTDAVLLAATARPAAGALVIDAGSGAGAAALAMLSHAPHASATLLERDPEMADLAAHNVAANGFAQRARVVCADLFDRTACRGLLQTGDVVLSNPPFHLAGEVRASGNAQQAVSHVLEGQRHGDWFRRLFAFARPNGRVVVIHRPEALRDFLDVSARRSAVTIRFIHAQTGGEAMRVIMDARLGSRAPMKVAAPLTLHGLDGRFTPEAESLHRGQW